MMLIIILIVIGVLFCISRVRSGRKSNSTDAERRRREAGQEDLDEDTDRYN